MTEDRYCCSVIRCLLSHCKDRVSVTLLDTLRGVESVRMCSLPLRILPSVTRDVNACPAYITAWSQRMVASDCIDSDLVTLTLGASRQVFVV